jgi:hypothetical protein
VLVIVAVCPGKLYNQLHHHLLAADPAGLSNTPPTETSTTISWNAVGGANNYDVDYKTNAASTWINAATATTALSVDLSGLTAGTLYDWRVRANCEAGPGNYIQANFTTATPPPACGDPTDIEYKLQHKLLQL